MHICTCCNKNVITGRPNRLIIVSNLKLYLIVLLSSNITSNYLRLGVENEGELHFRTVKSGGQVMAKFLTRKLMWKSKTFERIQRVKKIIICLSLLSFEQITNWKKNKTPYNDDWAISLRSAGVYKLAKRLIFIPVCGYIIKLCNL